MINVGPTADGMISPAFEERLRQLGIWLKVNGEAIYKSKPWSHQNDTITHGIWLAYMLQNITVISLVLFGLMYMNSILDISIILEQKIFQSVYSLWFKMVKDLIEC